MGHPDCQIRLISEFQDVDQLCHDVRYWDLQFQPLGLVPEDQKIAKIIQGRVAQFDCSYARFRMSFDQNGEPPQGKVTFTIPGESLGELWWRGQNTCADDVLVYLPGTELRSISAPDFEVHLLAADVAVIGSYMARSGFPVPHLSRLPSVFRAPGHILRKARSVLCRFEDDPASVDACMLDALVEGLVSCWMMQTGLQPRETAPNASRVVMEEILNAVASGDLADTRISDMCNRGGISRRALEIAFQEKFGTGPAAFLKSARLAQARRRLQSAADAKLSVADVMDLVGLSHVGQFAHDYRKMFGERPSDTLRRYS
ncbi:helix-turn-helix domain-containing protein [Roseibium sp. MMSF_3544]|uniref:AraC family transcriptional regulator n=1 Tax=unclassified Roseibium TaxID=2629323 RepID=UPI00273DA783|nr:helix-turn-helix domain-containing protein [Roseibium sp. MMSF_3544]